MNHTTFPTLPDTWEPTRATLHAYAHAVAAIPRAHAIAHPQWWHVSLRVRPSGLVTDVVPLPDGGAADVTMDLNRHEAVLTSTRGTRHAVPMNAGLTASEFGDALLAAAAGLGIGGDIDRERFESDEPRPYDESTATLALAVFSDVSVLFERHRRSLDGTVGPVQLWPHGFDLAFEWFGSRQVTYEEDGVEKTAPSQLNLGFFPGGEPYFYSTPWPFDEAIAATELPHGARWNRDGWDGSLLPYSAVASDPEGAARIADYARAVFEVAAPTLR